MYGRRFTVRCQITVHKVNFKAKIMLIYNTSNTFNLKKKRFTALIRFKFGYIIILPIITNVQKLLLHTGGGCLATRRNGQICPI